MRIDINCDLGESFGAWTLGQDAGVMPFITSANIACGFHAGDPGVMRSTVRLAREHGVAIGAHPGFPDLVGFGRRDMRASPQEIEDFVVYQIGALAGIAAAEGAALQHVKAHGALYNMAAVDRSLADAIAAAVRSVDRSLTLFGLPGSALLDAGRDAGLNVAAEVFADRSYEASGQLTPRAAPDAVIHDPDRVVARAILMVKERRVVARDGSTVTLEADTMCVHGDTPGAATLVSHLNASMLAAGITIVAPSASRRPS